MPPTLNGATDFGQPDEPKEVIVRLIVPEEFAGASMAELQFRRGVVVEMEVQGATVSIRASLPESGFGELSEAIRTTTQGRGLVEKRQ